MEVRYTGKNGKTLEDLFNEVKEKENQEKKIQAENIRKQEEERCEKLGCFLTAKDMIDYVLGGGKMVANTDTTDYIFYDKEHNVIVHHGYIYDDGTGTYYRSIKSETVDEFKNWANNCESNNLQSKNSDKYFNPYWNPIENVSGNS